MLALFEYNVQESVSLLASLVNISHHRICRQDLLAIDKQCDRCFFAEGHTFADDSLELDGLEVVGDQEPRTIRKQDDKYT